MNRTDISDISINNEGRRVLDCPDKIARWINYQYEEQEIKRLTVPSWPSIRIIDLSCCEICTEKHNALPTVTNLFDLADKVDSIKKGIDLFGNNNFHQEVFEEVQIRNSIIHAPFFHRTKFHKRVNIENSHILDEGSFIYCEFIGGLFLQDSIFDSFKFDGSIFGDEVYMFGLTINDSQVHLNRCTFRDNVRMSKITLKNEYPPQIKPYISFNNSVFKSNFELRDISFSRLCEFEYCFFEGQINFVGINANKIILSGSEFKDDFLLFNADWILNRIENLYCHNVKIYSRFDLSSTHICKFICQFAEIKSEGIFRIFASVITNLNMISLCNRGILFFEQNNVESQIKILKENGRINARPDNEVENEIKGLKKSECGITKLSLKNAISPGIIEIENSPVQSITNRRTARLLKDSAYKTNNIIDALDFKAKEMELYKKENPRRSIKLLLILNKYSNEYGLSWVRGVLFTLVSTLIFFWLINYLGTNERFFYITGNFDFKDLGDIIKSYLNLLNILNLKNGLSELKLNAFGEIMYLLSQIIIAYGIYQTVSAFRKYGKMN